MSSQVVSNNPFQNILNADLNQTDIVKDRNALLTEVRNNVAKFEKYMIIGAVALAALGVVLACTLGAAAIIPFVMVSALVYGIYNLERVKTNIDAIIADPSSLYADLTPVDSDKIKSKLKENTFYFDWAVDLAINNSPLAPSDS